MESEIRMELGELDVDPDVQPRIGGLDAAHVRALEENPEAWPPLVVVANGKRFTLVDGAHRAAAAQNLELASIRIQVVP